MIKNKTNIIDKETEQTLKNQEEIVNKSTMGYLDGPL